MPLLNLLRRFVQAGALLGLSFGCAQGRESGGDASACHALNTLILEHAHVESARFDAGGAGVPFQSQFFGELKLNLPASCRVKLILTPTSDSHIEAEVWMPATADWNKRLWSIGNGGLAGSIDELGLVVALSRGYASSSTDTGHQDNALSGQWGLGHPEKRIDYGHRAVHETAVNSKAVIKRFYGQPVGHAYFDGGSNGGRAALQEAQRYPQDYDGIEAGAPAQDGANTIVAGAWMEKQLRQSKESWIPLAKLQAISESVMQACDSLDGLKDGLIDDPRRCHPNTALLLCKDVETDRCLTPPQLASLRALYEGPGGKDPAGYAYYGYAPGGEANWGAWALGPTSDQSILYLFVMEFQKYLVHDDATWTLERFDIKTTPTDTFRQMTPFYQALDTDLSRFAARGGKLIIYHGWADRALQPQLSIDYYSRVQARMGADQTAKFVRLYMVPGMDHVFGGNGPNTFGQYSAPPAQSTAATNIGRALEEWVEKGVSPGPILGEEHINDPKAIYMDTGAPTRTRPLCPYPQVARYRGAGSIDTAENFACTAP
jgi:Tannase and feruloyl esterase